MILTKANIYNSPYLGIYSFCSNDFCIVPENILDKELKVIKKYLKTKIIKTHINQSPLIGVFVAGLGNKLIIGKDSVTNSELNILEKEGIKVKLIEDYNAIGNLIAMNSNYGFASTLLNAKTVKEIGKFLKIEIKQVNFSGIDIIGSALYVNENLFLVNPNISQKEFDLIKKKFKVDGKAITLNYGDAFVSNDIIANNNAILVGKTTSNIELMKVDELVIEF